MKRERVRSEIYRARRFKLKAARRARRDVKRAPLATCDQCELLSINGVVCHERGCPNGGARWDKASASWIKQRTCAICGSEHDADSVCCDHEEYNTDADEGDDT